MPLREQVAMPIQTNGDASIIFEDNSVSSTDWTSVSNLFQYYRCCAMKVRFIPSATSDTSFNYVAGYIFHDSSRINLTGATIATCVNYENCKIVNFARPWKYYRKMTRTIDPTVKQTNRSYTVLPLLLLLQHRCSFCVHYFLLH